nr:hypothetical protein CFP56_46303 [Quercus suber]
MVVPMLAFSIGVCDSFSLFSSCYLRGPLALVASKWFSPFRNKVTYQNLFAVNYLRLGDNDFNSAEPQDDQAAFIRPMLLTQHDQPIQFGSSYLNPHWMMQQ